MNDKPTRPTHNASIRRSPATRGDRAKWHVVGVGWLHPEKGGIAVKFNPFVDLSRMAAGDMLYLFPIENTVRKTAPASADDWNDGGKHAGLPGIDDEEIPF